MNIMVYFDIESVSDSTCSVTFYDGDSQYYGNGIMYKLLMDEESAVIFMIQTCHTHWKILQKN